MRSTLVIILSMLLLGCASARPEKSEEPSNKGYKVDQLFTDKNGHTVYRFWDAGDYRYYVVSPTGQSQMLPSTRSADRGGVSVGVGVGMGIR